MATGNWYVTSCPQAAQWGSLLRAAPANSMEAPGAYAGRKHYAVPLQSIVVVLLSVVIACIVFYAGLRLRHRCAHHDPLCRRARPCIACYREIYYGRKEGR